MSFGGLLTAVLRRKGWVGLGWVGWVVWAKAGLVLKSWLVHSRGSSSAFNCNFGR